MSDLKQRIIVVSDSHNHHELLKRIYEYENSNYSGSILYLHCGDSCCKYQDQIEPFISVRGNMDYLDELPFYKEIPVYKHKIFMTHGHFFNSKSINTMMDELGCDICMTGHTHVPVKEYKNNKWYINPGSVIKPRFMSKKQYMQVDIFDDGSIKITDKFIEDIM